MLTVKTMNVIFRAMKVSTFHFFLYNISIVYIRHVTIIFQIFKIYFILYLSLNMVIALEKGKLLFKKKLLNIKY